MVTFSLTRRNDKQMYATTLISKMIEDRYERKTAFESEQLKALMGENPRITDSSRTSRSNWSSFKPAPKNQKAKETRRVG